MKTRNKLIIWIITAAVILTSLSVFALSAAAEDKTVPDPPRVYQKWIYAQGTPIEIIAGTTESYTNILYDKDEDGVIESTEYLDIGTAATAAGYDLSEYEIFGGYSNVSYKGNMSIVMSGGKVKSVYGGNHSSSTVTGNTSVVVSGGIVTNVYGGGGGDTVKGNTYVTISGGTIDNVYGGAVSGTVDGNTNVVVSAGSITVNVYGGGNHMFSEITGNTFVTISGGTVGSSVYGGGMQGDISGNTNVTVTGGTVKNVYGSSSHNNASGSSNIDGKGATVVVSGGTVSNQIKDTAPNGSVSSSLVVTNTEATLNYYGDTTVHVIDQSITIPAEATLTIPEGKTLTIENGASLTNNGTIVNLGTIGGTVSGTMANNYTITLSGNSFTYTGSAIIPGVTVSNGNDQIVPDRVSYEGNVNAGTATVTVKFTAAGNVEVDLKKTFTIHPATISDNTVSLDKTEFYFSNQKIAPGVTVTFGGGTLTKYTDYEVSYSNNKEVGTATVTVTGIGNFTGTVTKNFTIKYLESPLLSEFVSDGHYSGSVYWFKDGADATVYSPYDAISTTLDGPYGESVTFGANDEKKVYLRKTLSDPGNGISFAITDAIDLSSILKWDSTAPTGEITLSPEIDVKSRWDGIDFKWFFESAQTLAVVAEDAESGIKSVEYYISNGKIDNMASIEEWKTYDEINRITLDKDAKYVVYVKITDNVGNVTYENTDGIVIFSDSTLNTTNINTVYKSTEEDQKISISLNGNTVNSVMVGGDELTKDTEYSVLDNGDISLKASYLNTLNAGQYTVTVMYNPQGELHVVNERNDSPDVTMMRLTVAKADPKYEIPTGLKGYHGQTLDDIALPIVPNGKWEWSIDPAVSTDLIGVGKKVFKASFIPNDQANYNNVYNVNVTIEVLPATVIPPMADRTVFVYNGEEQTYGIANTSVYKVEGNVKTLVGEYTVTIALIDKVNYVWPDGTTDDLEYEFVIERAPSVITAAPKANKLTYNGSLQALASEGRVIGGKLVYGLSSSSLKAPTEWHAEIPAVTNAGIYYVWYKVIGNELYKDVAPKQVRVVLEAKTVDIVWSDTEFAYDGEYHKPTATLVGVLDGDECEAEISGLRKTLGWHTARVVALSDPNYVVVENESVSFTISDSDGVYEAEIKAREEERAETKAEIKAEAEKTANTIVNAIVSVVKKALVSLVRNIFAR